MRNSLLVLLASSTAAAELLATPLPSLITSLLPRSGTSLHGEHSADQPSLYEEQRGKTAKSSHAMEHEVREQSSKKV